MYNIYPDRITVNRPGFVQNVIMTQFNTFLMGGVFNVAINGTTNAILNGVNNSAAMHKNEHPMPQQFESYRRNYLPGVAKELRGLQKAAIAEDSRIKEVFSNNLKPLNEINEVRGLWMLNTLQAKKPSEIINMMMKNRDIAAIALDPANYQLLGLPEAGREQLRQNIWRVNTQRNFEATTAADPSLDDLLGERVNIERASELASQAERELDQAREELGSVTVWMRSAIIHASVMADTSPDDVYRAMQRAA